MNGVLRDDIVTIFRAALERSHAGEALRTVLSLDDDRALTIGDHYLQVPPSGIYAIGVGKAAVEMITAAELALGPSLVEGIAVTKQIPNHASLRSTLLEGSHPIPDERSVAAGEAVLRFAERIPSGSLVLCLISGGGSALVELPRKGVTLADIREVTDTLLRGGASIHEINAVRSRLSQLKAGGLLWALRHATVVNVIVSDVLGDDPRSIASGLSVPPATGVDLDGILDSYNVKAIVPTTPDRDERNVEPALTVICASLSIAIDAAMHEARRLGYQPFVLSRSLNAEAREVGKIVGALLRDAAAGATSMRLPCCVLLGGEMVVRVTGSGVGGRNSEAALSAAIALQGTPNVAVGFLATDGDDGVTGAAGAIVDGSTVDVDTTQAARESLRTNDSFTYLQSRDATVVTGPTGTNVNDLIIAIAR